MQGSGGGVVAGVVVMLGAMLGLGCQTRGRGTRVTEYAVTRAPRGAQTERGACWTHSIAAAGRSDAWRCMVENQIHDPCFVIGKGPDLLCGADPSRPEEAHAFVLTLDKALPQEAMPAGVERAPWLVELADGTRCRPFTGTRPVAADGRAATYACTPEADGDNLIFGRLRETPGGVWTAEMGRLADGSGGRPRAAGLRQVAMAAVWR
ncbi:MAG: hypothetical protein ACTHJX_09755 [Terriglobales bacterium]